MSVRHPNRQRRPGVWGSRALAVALPGLLLSCLFGCADEQPGSGAAQPADAVSAPAHIAVAAGTVPPALTSTAADLGFVVLNAKGKPVSGVAVQASLSPGAGQLAAPTATSGADGTLQIHWTTGPLPIAQTLTLTAPGYNPTSVTADPTPEKPLQSNIFAQVDGWLTAHGIAGSTEDVAIAPDGSRAVMGVPGHLLEISPAGDVAEWAVDGPLQQPIGMMFDAKGTLWAADSKAKSLISVSPAGKVTAELSEVEGKPLIQPNDVFVDTAGRVWLTDPCRAQLMRYDPATQKTLVMASFNAKTQGGPNGIYLSPDGEDVWLTTENPGLLCAQGGIPVDKKLGSLWKAAGGDGPLSFAAVAEGVGVFGDGCALDELGNLYATFDLFSTEGGIHLVASQVLVVRPGDPVPRVAVESKDALFANVVFGQKGFAQGQMLIALLSVPPFTPASARGLMAVPAGVAGSLQP